MAAKSVMFVNDDSSYVVFQVLNSMSLFSL